MFFDYVIKTDAFGVITDQDDNNAYVWGYNESGKLSLGDRVNEVISSPERVTGFTGVKISKVLVSQEEKATIWLTEDGKVLTSGSADDYVLGRESSVDTSTALLIDYNDAESIIDIHMSYRSRWIIKENKSAQAFGLNKNYRLGIGSDDYAETPVDITLDLTDKDYIFITQGENSDNTVSKTVVAIKNSNNLYDLYFTGYRFGMPGCPLENIQTEFSERIAINNVVDIRLIDGKDNFSYIVRDNRDVFNYIGVIGNIISSLKPVTLQPYDNNGFTYV